MEVRVMTDRISLTMIVKNGEATLGRCLASVRELVNEIIIVDSGSSDSSREVAANFGAQIHNFTWCDDFAAARNEALRHSTGDWIFWLDADEYLDGDNQQKLRRLLANLPDNRSAFLMIQSSLSSNGAPLLHVPQIRLFRKHPMVQWEYRVHEQPGPSLRRAGYDLRGTDIVVTHTGYQDSATYIRKLGYYLRLLYLDRSDRPDDPLTLFNLGLTHVQLGHFAEAIPFLQDSLHVAQLDDPIVPAIYINLIHIQGRLGRLSEASATCLEGRKRYPDDPQLLFLDGQLHQAHGDSSRAEACWRELVTRFTAGQPNCTADSSTSKVIPNPFTAVTEGLVLASLQLLTALFRDQGRHLEVETLWRDTFVQRPSLRDAWRRHSEFVTVHSPASNTGVGRPRR
jgi:tetratricopeptide (TPR) repeat protein